MSLNVTKCPTRTLTETGNLTKMTSTLYTERFDRYRDKMIHGCMDSWTDKLIPKYPQKYLS